MHFDRDCTTGVDCTDAKDFKINIGKVVGDGRLTYEPAGDVPVLHAIS
jgi:hypothetical protein